MASWLEPLEELVAADERGEQHAAAIVALAAAAGAGVPLDEDAARGPLRRAVLLLAAGGDPTRELDLEGRAVTALAAELGSPERFEALAAGLAALQQGAAGLPNVSEALLALVEAPELAWRAYAASLLADELDGEG